MDKNNNITEIIKNIRKSIPDSDAQKKDNILYINTLLNELDDKQIQDIAKNKNHAKIIYDIFAGNTNIKSDELYQQSTEKLKQSSSAIKIQAAWRGYITRKKLGKLGTEGLGKKAKKASEGDDPETTGKDSDDVTQKALNNPNYEGTLEPSFGIMDRITFKKELEKIGCKDGEKDCPIIDEKSNRLLYLHGQIKNNNLKNGYPHDNITMNSEGNVSVEYDLDRAWSEYEYRRSLFTMSTIGSNGNDVGTYRSVIFKGNYYFNRSYQQGSLDVTPNLSPTTRPSEIIYVNGKGETIRYIGSEKLQNEIDEATKNNNKLNDVERTWLDNVIKYGETHSKIVENYADRFLNPIPIINEIRDITVTRKLDDERLEILREALNLDKSIDAKEVLDKYHQKLDLAKKNPQDIKILQEIDLQLKIYQLQDDIWEGKSEIPPFIKDILKLKPEATTEECKKAYNKAYQEKSETTKAIADRIKLEMQVALYLPEVDISQIKNLIQKESGEQLSTEEITNSPELLQKLQLETRLSLRTNFQNHASKLEGKEGDERYEALNAINRHENRSFSQNFVKQKFQTQEKILTSQKEKLDIFRKTLLDKIDSKNILGKRSDSLGYNAFEDLRRDKSDFPIADNGVAMSMNYVGAAKKSLHTTKVVKISFNKTKDGETLDEVNEQFVQIPGTSFYKRVIRVPAGKAAFVFKDGRQTEVAPSNEERILIDENTAWNHISKPIPGSGTPPKYATSPTPIKMLSNGTPSRALKILIDPAMVPHIARGYKNLGIEAISIENGTINSMTTQIAGKYGQNSIEVITQSDVARNMIKTNQNKIAKLINDKITAGRIDETLMTEDDEQKLRNEILAHEDNLNRLSRSGFATDKIFNNLIRNIQGYEQHKMFEIIEIDTRTSSKENVINKISDDTLENPALRILDQFIGEKESDKKPSIQAFRRQIARYAVLTANHLHSRSKREDFFAEIFDLANARLTHNGVTIDRDKFDNDLLAEIKEYAKAKGDKEWTISLPKGFYKIAGNNGRAEAGIEKFNSEEKGYLKDLNALEQSCLKILIEKGSENLDKDSDEMKKLMNLPVASLSRVIHGYQKTPTKITEVPPYKKATKNHTSEPYKKGSDKEKSDIDRVIKKEMQPSFEHIKHQIFGSSTRNFATSPINLHNPVDFLKLRQYGHEAGKWIVQTGKKEFNNNKDRDTLFIKQALENATEVIQDGFHSDLKTNDVWKDYIKRNIAKNIGQHALDKKEQLPNRPTFGYTHTKYKNIHEKSKDLASADSIKSTREKWVNTVENNRGNNNIGR